MAESHTIWAGMLGLATARFDVLDVYSPSLNRYLDVIAALEALELQVGALEQQVGALVDADDARITALEVKVTTLDETKAAKFVAVDPCPSMKVCSPIA